MRRQFSARSLASLKGVHPDLRRVIERALHESPLDFTVIEGLRTRERQTRLVSEGKSRTMNSRHLTGHAVDLMPIDPGTGRGSFDWSLYDQLGPAIERAAEAENVAIVWGGRWSSFRDGPHFELERNAYPAGVEVAARDRASPVASRTMQATATQTVTAIGMGASAVSYLDGTAQLVAMIAAAVIVVTALIVFRERLRAWAAGWR